MKVLFANNFCGYYGGAEQVVAQSANGLRSRGHQCWLAYSHRDRDAESFATNFEEVVKCSSLTQADRNPEGESFESIVDRVRPDAVFFHKVSALPTMTGALEAVRTVRMVHDTDLFCPTGLGYYRHGKKVCTHAVGAACYFDLAFLGPGDTLPIKAVSIPNKIREMRRNHTVDLILANSNYVRDRLVANGFPAERLHVCHPVINVPGITPSPVPESSRILYVGALLRGKGLDLFLRALKKVTCPFSATIVGSGKSERKLKSLCSALGLDSSVTFEGWTSHDKLALYYDEATVVALPFRGPETFSLVGIEAMHAGRPVVAFDVGGVSDWLEHERTGLLVPEQDVSAFARDLERVLTDREFAMRMGAESARRVREKFSFAKYLDQIETHLFGVDQEDRR